MQLPKLTVRMPKLECPENVNTNRQLRMIARGRAKRAKSGDLFNLKKGGFSFTHLNLFGKPVSIRFFTREKGLRKLLLDVSYKMRFQ